MAAQQQPIVELRDAIKSALARSGGLARLRAAARAEAYRALAHPSSHDDQQQQQQQQQHRDELQQQQHDEQQQRDEQQRPHDNHQQQQQAGKRASQMFVRPSNEAALVRALIREYLAFTGLRETLSVFGPESGEEPTDPAYDRAALEAQLGLPRTPNGARVPLLYSLVAACRHTAADDAGPQQQQHQHQQQHQYAPAAAAAVLAAAALEWDEGDAPPEGAGEPLPALLGLRHGL